MSGFAKLYGTITESSLWTTSKETRLLFITMLARCDETGFMEAVPSGLARTANLTLEETHRALEELGLPDPESKSKALDGRRVVKVDRGYMVVNYEEFRKRRDEVARREYMRDYMRKYRETGEDPRKHPLTNVNTVNQSKPCKPQLAQAEAETETETEKKTATDIARTSKSRSKLVAQICYDRDLMGFANVTDSDRKSWAEAYPACDITLELRRMVEWCKANPKKAHKSNWRKFIINWLTRNQDSGGTKMGLQQPESVNDAVDRVARELSGGR